LAATVELAVELFVVEVSSAAVVVATVHLIQVVV
jgi:hypothetical protein